MTEQLQIAISIAKQAGEILRKYYRKELDVAYKANEFDPVTQADKEADAFIRAELAKHFTDDTILSEEHDSRPDSYEGRVWMADPLDGTKDFVAGRDCFSVMIGLYEAGQPILGVVYVPIRGVLYYAELGQGAYVIENDGEPKQMHVSNNSDIATATRVTRFVQKGDVRPIEELLDKLPFAHLLPEGSIGIKVSRIANGEAEAFVHTNPSNKWDTLAAEVILKEAGGVITDIDSRALDYKQASVTWQRYLIAANNETIRSQVAEVLKDFHSSN
jgi:3'(2'), 5'-bisphosphate nucleotidase